MSDDMESFNDVLRNLRRSAPQILQGTVGGATKGSIAGPYGTFLGGLAGLGTSVAQAAASPQGGRPRVASAPATPAAAAATASSSGQIPPDLAAQLLSLALSSIAGAGQPNAARPAAPALPPTAPPPTEAYDESEEDLFEWVVSSGMAEAYDEYQPRQRRGVVEPDQRAALPTAAGLSVGEDALRPGDIILSTTDAAVSRLVRIGSMTSVSHAGLYVGEGDVVEALGAGVLQQPLRIALGDDTLAVAFRHPTATPRQLGAVVDYVRGQRGRRFDGAGIFVEALFQLPGGGGPRRLPLGADHDDRFFCSDLVIEAFEHAGLPLLTAGRGPGSLAALAGRARLVYVGHLKA